MARDECGLGRERKRELSPTERGIRWLCVCERERRAGSTSQSLSPSLPGPWQLYSSGPPPTIRKTSPLFISAAAWTLLGFVPLFCPPLVHIYTSPPLCFPSRCRKSAFHTHPVHVWLDPGGEAEAEEGIVEGEEEEGQEDQDA